MQVLFTYYESRRALFTPERPGRLQSEPLLQKTKQSTQQTSEQKPAGETHSTGPEERNVSLGPDERPKYSTQQYLQCIARYKRSLCVVFLHENIAIYNALYSLSLYADRTTSAVSNSSHAPFTSLSHPPGRGTRNLHRACLFLFLQGQQLSNTKNATH